MVISSKIPSSDSHYNVIFHHLYISTYSAIFLTIFTSVQERLFRL